MFPIGVRVCPPPPRKNFGQILGKIKKIQAGYKKNIKFKSFLYNPPYKFWQTFNCHPPVLPPEGISPVRLCEELMPRLQCTA